MHTIVRRSEVSRQPKRNDLFYLTANFPKCSNVIVVTSFRRSLIKIPNASPTPNNTIIAANFALPANNHT